LAQESDIAENSSIRILRSLNEAGEYMYKNEGDMVMPASRAYAGGVQATGFRMDQGFARVCQLADGELDPESLVIAVN
jgi:hypothetical protein